MRNTGANSKRLEHYLLINALALLAAEVVMVVIVRSEGASRLRLALTGGTILLCALAFGGSIWLHLHSVKQQAIHEALFNSGRRLRLTWAFGILFLIFWCLTWIPPEYTGKFRYYFTAFYSLILCGTLASGCGLIFIESEKKGISASAWKNYWLEHRAVLITMVLSLAGFAVVVLLTRALRILESNEPFWRGASVPILASQVLIAVIIGVLLLKVETIRLLRNLPLDLLLFLLIWAVTAVLWAARPVPESFWVTGPLRPNQEYYPFSDLITYDVGSQFALIGQGINNSVFFDRALYMSFLVYLHSLGGQNYQQLMSIQAAIFAVFPAITYSIGRTLHSRIAGMVLAVLTTLRGLNSLTATPWIHSSTFKHMLTDFPTAIGLAIFVLLMLKWLQSPQSQRYLLFWASGVIGLTSLLRPHVLLLLPLVFLLAFFVETSGWRQRLITLGLTLLAFLASIAPWMFFAPGAGSFYSLYGQRIQSMLQQRYGQTSFTPPGLAEQAPPASAAPTAPLPPVPSIRPSNITQVPFPVTQFLHNLVTSALDLPDSPQFLSVIDTVNGHEGFWQLRWDGAMSPVAAAMVILNLALIALGLGAAYRFLRWYGFLPLAVFLVYQAANGLARTSGGRYLVPIDWVVVVYYALGLAEAVQMAALLFGGLANSALPASNHARQAIPAAAAINSPGQKKGPWHPHTWMPVLLLGLIGGLVPLAGALYPLRYPPASATTLGEKFRNIGLSAASLDAFLQTPGAVALYGRALYPRFYRRGTGELYAIDPFLPAGYARTVFVLIGPQGMQYVTLPGAAPQTFPNASDIVLLGCQSVDQGNSVVSALEVALPGQAVSYARSPAAPLSCPVPAPVCDDNGNCH